MLKDIFIKKKGKVPDMVIDRVKLSQMMVDPIKIALDYNSIGRKLLMVDELPQGALARYERQFRQLQRIKIIDDDIEYWNYDE